MDFSWLELSHLLKPSVFAQMRPLVLEGFCLWYRLGRANAFSGGV
jgi:hypothetical protein